MPSISSDEESFHRAVLLQQSGDYEAAHAIFRQLFPRHKNTPEFLIQMAISSVALDKDSQARKLAHDILRIRPDAGSAHNILGVTALRSNDTVSAISHFQDYIACTQNNAEAYLNLAQALNKVNRGAEAADHQRQACDIAPGRASSHYTYGSTLRSLGQLDDAIAQFHRALEIDPTYGGAWKMLAELGQLTPAMDQVHLDQALSKLVGQEEEQAKIHFALAEMFEKAKDHDQAFSHFVCANDKVRTSLDYDVAEDEALMAQIATTFQPKLLERFAGRGIDGTRMIFIVGMPRSGTTLVEQILAGHSQVYASGELPYLKDALCVKGTRGSQSYPNAARRWTQKDLHAVGRHYLAAVDTLSPTAPYVTDKMPSNFLHIGAIRTVFPQARIVHCTRNPVDTCLGNYRQMFTNGQHFSYAQADLVRYFKAYQGLMTHWHSLFGEEILDISYEHLVQNIEEGSRTLIAHCGLDWQDGCIDIAKSTRPVYTASASQVRQGIHSQFVDRWRKYTVHIQPLLSGLNSDNNE